MEVMLLENSKGLGKVFEARQMRPRVRVLLLYKQQWHVVWGLQVRQNHPTGVLQRVPRPAVVFSVRL